MNRRTYILALAVTASDVQTLNEQADADDVIEHLMATAENITVVALLDREQPQNNIEPQVFADYYEADFTKEIGEVGENRSMQSVNMEGRIPNCCEPGFSNSDYPDIELAGYDNAKAPDGYW